MKTLWIKKFIYGCLLCAVSVPMFGFSADKALPRGQASDTMRQAMTAYLNAVKAAGEDLHSIMVVQHGKVIAAEWMGEGAPDKPHILNSVSKTFTATAIGFAVAEGKLKVTDKVISFFPDKLPANVSPYLQDLEIYHLLTMSVGQEVNASNQIKNMESADWVKEYLALPIVNKPGSVHTYSSMASYTLSAIVQKVSGQKLIDYLTPRLFEPLGIDGISWEESPQGINCGGWGLFVKTEDMAKLGLLLLQKGSWEGKQLVPASWVEEATSYKIASMPAGMKPEDIRMKPEDSDWLQGYGYQMWLCRHNAIRADGANGQYIIILPEKNAVIVTTARVNDMQEEINLIWQYILPVL